MNEFQSTQSDKQNLSFSTIQSVLSLLPDSRCPNPTKNWVQTSQGHHTGVSGFRKAKNNLTGNGPEVDFSLIQK